MDVMLQRHGTKRIYPVPEGLRELCTDISREVLRAQPTNIYGFIAEYLDALIISRENAKLAAGILSEILDETVSYESAWRRRGITLDEATHSAITIQAAYRGFITRKAYRTIPAELENFLLRCGIDWRTANRASRIIQARFRGYLARKMFRAHKKTSELLTQLGIDVANASKACLIIQTAYRSHRARLYVKNHTVPDYVTNMNPEERMMLNRYMIFMNIDWNQANSAAYDIQNAFRRKLTDSPMLSREGSLSLVKEITPPKFPVTVKEHKPTEHEALRVVSSLIFRAAEQSQIVVKSVVDALKDKKKKPESLKGTEDAKEVTKGILSSILLTAVGGGSAEDENDTEQKEEVTEGEEVGSLISDTYESKQMPENISGIVNESFVKTRNLRESVKFDIPSETESINESVPADEKSETAEVFADKEAEDLTDKEGEDLTYKEGEDLTDKEGEDLTDKEGEDLTDKEGEDLTDKEEEDLTDKEGEDLTDKEGEDLTHKETEELTDKETEELTDKETEELTDKETEELTDTDQITESEGP